MFAVQRIFSKSAIARAAIAALIAVSIVNVSASPANAAGTESRITNLSKVERSTVDNFSQVLHSTSGHRMLAIGAGKDPATSSDGGKTWASTEGVSREWDLLASSANLDVSLATENTGRTQANNWQVTGGELYISTSYGGSFQKITPNGVSKIWTAVGVSGAGNLLFAAAGTELYWSKNAGTSWSLISLAGTFEAGETPRVLSMVVGPDISIYSDQLLIGLSTGDVQLLTGFATATPNTNINKSSVLVNAAEPGSETANDINILTATSDGDGFTKVFAGSKDSIGFKTMAITTGNLSGSPASDPFAGRLQSMKVVNSANDLFVTTDSASYFLIGGIGTNPAVAITEIPTLKWRVVSTSSALSVNGESGKLYLQSNSGETFISLGGTAHGAFETEISKFGIVDVETSDHGLYALSALGGVLKQSGSQWIVNQTLAVGSDGYSKAATSENNDFVVFAGYFGSTAIISSTQSVARNSSSSPIWTEPKFIAVANDGSSVVVAGIQIVSGSPVEKIWLSSDAGQTFNVISDRSGITFTDLHLDGSSNNLYVASVEYGLEKFTADHLGVWSPTRLAAASPLVFDKFTVSPGEQQIIAGVNKSGAYYITDSGPQLISALGNHEWTDFEIESVGTTTWSSATSADGQIQLKEGGDGTWKTVLAGAEVSNISIGTTLAYTARPALDSQAFELYIAAAGWALTSVAGSFYPDNIWDATKFKFGLYDDDNEINNLSHFLRVDRVGITENQYLCEAIGTSPCTVSELNAANSDLRGKLTLPTCQSATQVMCLESVEIYQKGQTSAAATLDTTFDVGTPSFAAQPTYGLPVGGTTSVWTSAWEHKGGTGSGDTDGSQYAVNASATLLWDKTTSKVFFSDLVASVTPFNNLESPGYKANTVSQQDSNGSPVVGYSMNVPDGRCVIVKTDYCGRVQDFADNTQVEVSIRVPKEVGGWYKGRMVDPAISTSPFAAVSGNQVITVSAQPALVPRLQVDIAASQFKSALNTRGQSQTVTDIGDDVKDGYGIGIAASNSWAVNIIKALLGEPAVIPNKATGFNTVWSFGTLSADFQEVNCPAAAGTSVLGIIATDAMAYSDFGPTLDPTTGTLDYQVAGAHFKPDGVTEVKGNYQMSLNLALAKCQWGLTDDQLSTSALANAVSVVDASGVTKAVDDTSVSIDSNWLTFKASGFTFSEPKIKVQLKPATVNSSGDSTPVATPTPTPSVTPTPAAEAKPAPLKVPASVKLGFTTKVAIPAAAKAIAGVKVTVRQSAATKKICVATPVISGGKVVAVNIKALKKSLVGCAFMLNTTVPASNTKFESSSERYVVPIK